MDHKDIAVVGMACRWPGISDLTQFWRHVVNGRKIECGTEDEVFPDASSGSAFQNDGGNGKTTAADEAQCPESDVLLQVVGAVLQDSGLAPEDGTLGRTDLIIIQNVASIPMQPVPALSSRDPAVQIGDLLKFGGECHTMDGMHISLSCTVREGAFRLRQNLCDAVVIASLSCCGRNFGQPARDVPLHGSCDATPGCLDGGRSGACAILLRRREDCESCNAGVYALLKGFADPSEKERSESKRSSNKESAKNWQKAYEDAGVSPGTIGFLEVRSSLCWSDGIAGEEEALRGLGELREKDQSFCPMGSVGDLFDTPLHDPGMAALIKAVLCVSNKIIPPGLPCEEPEKERQRIPFYVNHKVLPWIQNNVLYPRRAAVSLVEPDGSCSHLIVEEAVRRDGRCNVREIHTGLDQETELVVLSAGSLPELRRKVQSLSHFLEKGRSDEQLSDIACTLSKYFCADDSCRLALVCRDLGQLTDFLAVCRSKLENDDPNFEAVSGIHFTSNAAYCRGKVICIFPGLTFPGLLGTYSEHLRELCLHFPEMREVFDKADNRPEGPRESIPTHHYFFPPEYLAEDERNRLHQSLGIPNVESDRVLHRGRATVFCLLSQLP